MKYIIKESILPKLISKFIEDKYGEIEPVYSDIEEQINFYNTDGQMRFMLNDYGTLWIPQELSMEIWNLFGYEDGYDFDLDIISAFERMFGLTPKRVNIYWD